MFFKHLLDSFAEYAINMPDITIWKSYKICDLIVFECTILCASNDTDGLGRSAGHPYLNPMLRVFGIAQADAVQKRGAILNVYRGYLTDRICAPVLSQRFPIPLLKCYRVVPDHL